LRSVSAEQADLCGDRPDGRPLRAVVALVLENHSNGPFLDFWGKSVLLAHDSILSRLGVSGNPGAVQWGDSGRFIWKEESWICQGARPDARRVSDQKLREIIRKTTLPEVQRVADVILEGEIVDVQPFALSGPDGHVSRGLRVAMRPTKVYKGIEASSIVTIVVVASGNYSPHWRRSMPVNYKIGQQWLAFLKPLEGGYYYPFSGSNGMFQAVNGELIYDGRKRYGMNLRVMREFLLKDGD